MQVGDGVQLRKEPLARTPRAGGRAEGNRHAAARADGDGRHARLHLLARLPTIYKGFISAQLDAFLCKHNFKTWRKCTRRVRGYFFENRNF